MEKNIPVAIPNLLGNELQYVQECVQENWISSKGKFVDQFGQQFAEFCNRKYGIPTSNGTTALHLALVALGIGPGDEVIVPNLTFAATVNAVLYTGATPVLVDIEEISWNIDPDKIELNITEQTKAIIPVHLYGQPCNMDRIMQIANQNNLYIIEDCAEAHGAKYHGQIIGSFGDISCFSFYGNKIISTGEGGICLTNDAELNEKLKMLRDHGMNPNRRYYHEQVGFNYRMTNLQAAIGLAQLERINEFISKRNKISGMYDQYLQGIKGITLQPHLKNYEKICWMYSILIDSQEYGLSRDQVRQKLDQSGIETRSFFYCLNEMEIYKQYEGKGGFNVSTKVSAQGINLPTFVDLDRDLIQRIVRLL